jgi:hypothetical protein
MRISVLLMAATAFSAMITFQTVGAEMEPWPGCDGVQHQIPVPHNYKQCMANGPRLNCPEDATKAHCRAKFPNG